MLWTIKEPKTNGRKLKSEEIIKILLRNRGLRTKKEIHTFLNPLSPPDLNLEELGISRSELSKAVKRIKKAIENGEGMAVWGDYDADGICGTAILWEVIYALGGKVMPYIPDRITEGYGLNKKAIRKLQDSKALGLKLIITVDHGITAHEKIKYAKDLGLDVIVTDHHQLEKTKPKAQAVVHSTKICGAAVAWVLAQHLRGEAGQRSAVAARPHLGGGRSLDLVAIGTITDLMPLVGSNRSFVKFGLKGLNKTRRIGLLALIKEADLKPGEINTYQVSWMIGPRLNASGRLEDAMDSLRLLCTQDEKRAKDLAGKLGRINKERQGLLEKTFVHAEGQALNLAREKLIFISDQSYHEGIIGLVASKLVQKFYRPAIVVSQGEICSKASARSVNSFNIIKAIRDCGPDLVDCGGHPMAAGFTVETKKLKSVSRKLTKITEEKLGKKTLTKTLKVDCELRLADLTFRLEQAISRLAPFGVGNSQPVFATRGLKVLNARLVGKNRNHLKLLLDDPRTPRVERTGAEAELLLPPSPFDGIAFGLGEIYPQLSKDKLIDVAYNLSLDEWNNQRKLQLKIKDIKIA